MLKLVSALHFLTVEFLGILKEIFYSMLILDGDSECLCDFFAFVLEFRDFCF